MNLTPAIKGLAQWVLPPKIQEGLENRLLWRLSRGPGLARQLKKNARFKNLHAGKRCFILCCGPSINEEDLTPLADEICFSVSNFYKHPLYPQIKPQYHCVPNVLPPHTDEEIARWFQEMHAATGNATLFLGTRQEPLVRKENLFPERDVNWLHMSAGRLPTSSTIDITRGVVRVQSVPIMCLMIALYMGFRQIYLLGTDHDSLWNGTYHYCFDRDRLVLTDPSTDGNGCIKDEVIRELQAHLRLWQQYESLRDIAAARSVRIINLARGSRLDVFPTGALASVLAPELTRHRG